jgi:hypothetical protein
MPLCPLLPQGCGLHPLRDGHREAPLPRLHRQGGAAPHLSPPRSVFSPSLFRHQGAPELRPTQARLGTGQDGLADLNRAGSSWSPLCCLLSHCIRSMWLWSLTHAIPTHSRLFRDPYGRDVARCDSPLRVPSLQLSAVPATASAQPCSQVALPPAPPLHALASPSQRPPPSQPTQTHPVSVSPPCRLDTDGINLLTSLLLVSILQLT